MRKIILSIIVISGIYVLINAYFFEKSRDKNKLKELISKYSEKHVPSVDHSKLPQLNKKFETPQDVTLACISCHTERHFEIMQTAHWRWEREEFIEGRGVTYHGKKNSLNNFCMGIGGSEMSCTKCHVGYGWKDSSFDFNDFSNIDCLICHDNSETYIKGQNKAGYPDEKVDLTKVAQSVGLPKKYNCGFCHFFSGGGNNVKHGDLEKALFNADKNLDVHMNMNGLNMECVECHTAENHRIKGKLYTVSSMNRDRLFCEDCHTETPHEKGRLNEHTVKVACQTCHIPEYAKANATKMYWDWSKAGNLKDGEPYSIEDENGNITYLSIKGEFKWDKNLKPDYIWFNGTANHYFPCDKVDTTEAIKLNTLYGKYSDRESKIIPVKIHRAKQIYDCRNKVLIQPKLFSETREGGGYWKKFDWETASMLGMLYNKERFGIDRNVDSCFSKNYCFVETEMYWPINHMVAPKEQALKCEECHTRNNSRMDGLAGFYIPARDNSFIIDTIGWIVIVLSLLSVLVHGAIRIVTFYLRNMKN
jgi:octaheme c-type cytochrome (tetrathionate reductase family)